MKNKRKLGFYEKEAQKLSKEANKGMIVAPKKKKMPKFLKKIGIGLSMFAALVGIGGCNIQNEKEAENVAIENEIEDPDTVSDLLKVANEEIPTIDDEKLAEIIKEAKEEAGEEVVVEEGVVEEGKDAKKNIHVSKPGEKDTEITNEGNEYAKTEKENINKEFGLTEEQTDKVEEEVLTPQPAVKPAVKPAEKPAEKPADVVAPVEEVEEVEVDATEFFNNNDFNPAYYFQDDEGVATIEEEVAQAEETTNSTGKNAPEKDDKYK